MSPQCFFCVAVALLCVSLAGAGVDGQLSDAPAPATPTVVAYGDAVPLHTGNATQIVVSSTTSAQDDAAIIVAEVTYEPCAVALVEVGQVSAPIPVGHTALRSPSGALGFRIVVMGRGSLRYLSLSSAPFASLAGAPGVPVLLRLDATASAFGTVANVAWETSKARTRAHVTNLPAGTYVMATAKTDAPEPTLYDEWHVLSRPHSALAYPQSLDLLVDTPESLRTVLRPRVQVSRSAGVPSTYAAPPSPGDLPAGVYVAVTVEPSDATVRTFAAGVLSVAVGVDASALVDDGSEVQGDVALLRWRLLQKTGTGWAWRNAGNSTFDSASERVVATWTPDAPEVPTVTAGGRSHTWVLGLFRSPAGTFALGNWFATDNTTGGHFTAAFASAESGDDGPTLSLHVSLVDAPRVRLSPVVRPLLTMPDGHDALSLGGVGASYGYALEVDPLRGFLGGTLTMHVYNPSRADSAVASGGRLTCLRCALAYDGDCETVHVLRTAAPKSGDHDADPPVQLDIVLSGVGRYIIAIALPATPDLAMYARPALALPPSPATFSLPFGLTASVQVPTPAFVSISRTDKYARPLPLRRNGIGVFLRLSLTSAEEARRGIFTNTGDNIDGSGVGGGFSLSLRLKYDDARRVDAEVSASSLQFVYYDSSAGTWRAPTNGSVDTTAKEVYAYSDAVYVEWAVIGIAQENMMFVSSGPRAHAHVAVYSIFCAVAIALIRPRA